MSGGFDHREPGTSEAEWQSASPWAAAPRLDPILERDIDTLVVLAAHPDDETLGAAGLIATAAARGIRITVVVATDGEGSHPDSPTWSRHDLARERRAELVRAIDALAPGSVLSFLGLPDGELRDHRTSLTRLVRPAIAADRAGRAEPVGDPLRTLIVAPWAGDGHRDHRVLGEVADELARELGHRSLGYPVWLWHWAHPADVETHGWTVLTLDAEAHAAKLRALALHATQVRPLSPAPGDEAVIHAGMRAHFERGVEVFIGSAPEGAAESASLAPAFFDAFYSRHDDPWGFDTRWYEERKRALVMASLPRPRFHEVLELGCATGALTVELAARADRVRGLDASEEALSRARERLARHPAQDRGIVALEQATVPLEWPTGVFDLIVLSEIGYYWSRPDLLAAARKTLASLSPDGVLVACHWRHPVAEYPGTADEVHAELRALPGLRLLARHDEEDFFLDILVRTGEPSVARAAGITL